MEWISVEDRLPTENECLWKTIVVCRMRKYSEPDDDGNDRWSIDNACIAEYDYLGNHGWHTTTDLTRMMKGVWGGGMCFDLGGVTHWKIIDLPLPPKET